MANSTAKSALFDWQSGYQTAMREFENGSVGFVLNRAIAECIFNLREFPSRDSDFAERRSCLTALSDLLVLRTLHFRYEALNVTCEATGYALPT